MPITSFTPPAVTLLYAATAGLINAWLSFRVAQVRIAGKTNMGFGATDSLLYARGRAHANFNEYVPLALVMMLVIELGIGPSLGLRILGAVLIVGRLLHMFGMERPAPNPLRMIGIMATMVVTIGLAGWALWLALHG